MSNIVIFDPESVVQNRITEYLTSVNTIDYVSNPNVIINPDLSSVFGVNQKYWKVDSGNVIEMTTNEKTAIDNFLNAKTLRNKNYKVLSYNSFNQLSKETWYEKDNGDGTYSDKAEEITFSYNDNKLDNKVDIIYYYDGSICSSETWNYYMNDQNQIIEKKV